MMAALFLILALALLFIYPGMRKTGITLLIVGLILCMLMLWYHMDEPLKVIL